MQFYTIPYKSISHPKGPIGLMIDLGALFNVCYSSGEWTTPLYIEVPEKLEDQKIMEELLTDYGIEINKVRR
jgi:hypothetical protein